MAAASGTGTAGWVVALGLGLGFAITQLDPSLLRRPEPVSGAAAVLPGLAPVPAEEPEVDPYELLAAEAAGASGEAIAAVDRKIESAEREHATDYRYTLERAGLAVFGRAEHHEAFHLLRKAADKAIATGKAAEMLEQLERDGGSRGRLRKLSVGHVEWTELREALATEDRERLWHKPAPRPHRNGGHANAGEASTPKGKRTAERHAPHPERVPAPLMAAALLEDGKPCQALIALRSAPPDARLASIYRQARGECLGDLDSR